MKYLLCQYLIPSFVNSFTILYFQSKLMKKNINKYTRFICFVILCMGTIFNTIFINGFIRFIFITLFISIFFKIIFKEDIRTTLIFSLIQQSILFISELLYVLIFNIFHINAFKLSLDNTICYLLLNIIIPFTAILIYNIPLIKNKSLKLVKILNKIDKKIIYIIIVIFLLTLNFFLMSSYEIFNGESILIINIFFMIIYTIIIYFFVREKYKNIEYKEANKNLIINLNEYEKMLDYQKVNNHENKNQLLVIKSLIKKNDCNVLEYIDEIIKEKREDDEVLYKLSKKIPSGGLQGLIYQKMLIMKENKIALELFVSKNMNKINYNMLSLKMNYELCRAVGIIIDNAIEASKKCKKKKISISIYYDEKINIEISNYFDNDINFDLINMKGYTTKGKGHGYGLNLLNQIVKKYQWLDNETIVINDIFVQNIKLEI